jgi:G6PDH family F420-dependent oxidoreductase
MGAAMAATVHTCGTVCAPGYRYHPAIVAQMGATLAQMFPGRFWLAIGSGELLNEHITGQFWPPKDQRNRRLQECADVIRALWAGETVSHYGLVTVEEAHLYTRPEQPPLLIGAALTPATARFLGSFTDGLLTTARPIESLREMIEAYQAGGGDGKPLFLKLDVSYASDYDTALHSGWEHWRQPLAGVTVINDLRSPAQLDAIAEFIPPEHVAKAILIATHPQPIADAVRGYAELGFQQISLHNVNCWQERFLDDFGPLLQDGSLT